MSVVSASVDNVILKGNRRRNFLAVGRAVPDSSIVSATPRQVPNFCISKHIAKPFLYGDAPKAKMGVVPLKSLQEFSHVEGVSLFNAPVELVPVPLKQVLPQRRTIDMESLIAEMPQVGFQPVFDYAKGIRPSARVLKGGAVPEPDAPFPTRVGRPGADTERFGTYDQGKLAYDILGY